MKYKGKYVEDDNTVVVIYGSDLVEVHLKIPNRCREEALEWLDDKILSTADVEVIIV